MRTADALLTRSPLAAMPRWRLPPSEQAGGITLVVSPGPQVDVAWLDDAQAACEANHLGAFVMVPSSARDPLGGVRHVMRSALPELPASLHDAHGAALRTLFAGELWVGEGASLDDVALPSSERRLSRESERLFRLANGVAAMLSASVASGRGWCLLVPDLLEMDRLSLHLLHQLRRFARPGIRIVAGIAQADVLALEAMPASGELSDPQALRQRFVKDSLSLGPHVSSHRPGREAARTRRLWQAQPHDAPLTADDIARLIEWGQYDQALNALEQLPTRDFGWYKAAGLTHAYLGQFERAAQCYAQAGETARTAAQRAELHVYRALLASKRKGEHTLAQQIVEAGRCCLEGAADDGALIEQGWLSNVAALIHFSQGRHADAMALCKSAYLSLKPCKGSDALHLKINLISNLSVVFESMGRMTEALAVWQNFSQFLGGSATALFAKIYHYRVAGLLWKAGDAGRAEAAYRRSYEEAQRVHDGFHLLYIAHDIGVLRAQQGDWAEAQAWFERSEAHARAVAEHERTGLAVAAQGCARQQRGDTVGAHACWSALQAEPNIAIGLRGVLPQLQSLGEGDVLDEALRACLLPPPGSKLGRPFHLVHIPPLRPALNAAAVVR